MVLLYLLDCVCSAKTTVFEKTQQNLSLAIMNQRFRIYAATAGSAKRHNCNVLRRRPNICSRPACLAHRGSSHFMSQSQSEYCFFSWSWKLNLIRSLRHRSFAARGQRSLYCVGWISVKIAGHGPSDMVFDFRSIYSGRNSQEYTSLWNLSLMSIPYSVYFCVLWKSVSKKISE